VFFLLSFARSFSLKKLKSLAAMALVVLASGCASVSGPGEQAIKKEPTSKSAGLVSPAKGGGYYDRDGPPEVAPADLAQIADAVPKSEPIKASANRPYSVFGQRYEPMTKRTAFSQNGVASWYGKQFHGRKTSSGETYDMLAMTAAHPTLPIPSFVRVTNLKNGKQVVVRVNDRGPFLHNRAIDLSYAAATKLGYTASGHTQVSIELLLPEGSNEAPQVLAQSQPAPLTKAQPRLDPSPIEVLQPVAVAAVKLESTPALVLNMSTVSSTESDPLLALLEAPKPDPKSSSVGESKPSLGSVSSTSSGTISGTMIRSPSNVFLQLGAFTTRENAEASMYKVARLLPESEGLVNLDQSEKLIRLRMGPMTLEQANLQADRVERLTGSRPMRIFSK
jgi:rare lipoprotein A